MDNHLVWLENTHKITSKPLQCTKWYILKCIYLTSFHKDVAKKIIRYRMNSTEGHRVPGTCQIGRQMGWDTWGQHRNNSGTFYFSARQHWQILGEIVLRKRWLVQVLFLGGWLVQKLFPGSWLVWKLFPGCLAPRLPCLQGLLKLQNDNGSQKLVWNDNFFPITEAYWRKYKYLKDDS